MKLPDDLKLRNTAHGSGAQGMAFYTYEDTAGLGVVMQARRENGRARFVQTWRFMWSPDRVCTSFQELADAVLPLTNADIAAEKGRWPQLGAVRNLIGTNSPNTCMRHRGRPGVIQASVATCWIPGQGLVASLCEECRPAATGNGHGIVDIMDERRRQVAAMQKSPLQMIMDGSKP